MFSYLQRLKSIPWATMGRRETTDQLMERLRLQRSDSSLAEKGPRFSLIIAVDRELDLAQFSTFLASLKAQSYGNWEALFVARPNSEAVKILALHDAKEHSFSIRWLTLADHSSTAELHNAALENIGGDWWMNLDPQAILHPSALYLLAAEITARPGADVLYTNEIILDEKGKSIVSMLAKPSLSWVDLVHFPYLGRLVAVRTGVKEPGQAAFDSVYPCYHEMDFYFRLIEQEKVFRALPFYLYYRTEQDSTLVEHADEWQKVVEAHLRRKGFPALCDVASAKHPMALSVAPIISRVSDRLVSAVICFKDKADLTLKAVERLSKQVNQVALEVILVNNRSSEEEVQRLKSGLSKISVNARVIDYPHEFNFAKMNNLAIRDHARGEIILLLNNDVFWKGERTLDQLVAWALLRQTGTVGIRLDYPSGKLQHAGLAARFGGEARMARIGNLQTEDRYTNLTKEVFVNTFAACAFRRQTFDRVGGLREMEFANGFGDVVFNFACIRNGLTNVCLGGVRAEHLESASRGEAYEYWEEVGLEREFPDLLAKMLRQDLGENRVPGQDVAIASAIKEVLPPNLKKGLRNTWNLFRGTIS